MITIYVVMYAKGFFLLYSVVCVVFCTWMMIFTTKGLNFIFILYEKL